MKINHYHYHFILSLSFYILPVILFGELYNLNNIIFFLISILVISFFVNYKIIDNKEWPTYIYSSLHGFCLSFLGLSLFGISVKNPMISISVSVGCIPGIVSMIGFIAFARLFRERKKLEYLKQFEGDSISLERDKKINKILGNFINS